MTDTKRELTPARLATLRVQLAMRGAIDPLDVLAAFDEIEALRRQVKELERQQRIAR